MHVTYAPRAALLHLFRQPAPKCSLNPLRCPALSVGDANFLSVSVNQSLVLSLFLVQHFSLLKLVSNISTSFFVVTNVPNLSALTIIVLNLEI